MISVGDKFRIRFQICILLNFVPFQFACLLALDTIFSNFFDAKKLTTLSGSGFFIWPVSVGNTEKLKEMLLSIPIHMQNIHVFPENKHYKVCI
jgi:hypothetical protein